MMDNKTKKIIYKLRIDKNSERQIKKILGEKYNIVITLNEIKKVIDNIPYNRCKYTALEKEKILYMYKNIINTYKLIDYLNNKYRYDLTYNKIKDLASRHLVKKNYQNMYEQSFINRKEEYEIVKLYNQGFTAKQISQTYGYKTPKSIFDKLDKFNVERRDWNAIQSNNRSYKLKDFKYIDNEEDAYFLGLMLTDGYVNKERNYIGIDLIDKDVIEFISDRFKAQYTTINSKKGKTKYRIILYGKNIVNNLNRIGLTERKTYTLDKLNLYEFEKCYIAYILRGIIDGDGWIRKDGLEFFISSASIKFINWCKFALEEIGMENIKINFVKNEFNGIYIIRSAKLSNIEILKTKVYDKRYGMNRKYDLLLGKTLRDYNRRY